VTAGGLASITLSGGSPWFGAIVGKTLNDSGGPAIHFDRDLPKSLITVGPSQMTGFSWSKL
jgi:hypothetical protein